MFVPALTVSSIACEVGVGAAAAGVILGLTSLAGRFPIMEELEAEFARILGRLAFGEVCLLAVASGIGEEVLFRGALQPIVGYVPASLLFGCVHTGPDRRFFAWTLFALGVGFAFGGVVMWRESLLAVITAHALVNGVSLFRISRIAPSEPQKLSSDPPNEPV
ncbi:MAG: CPBP family intramembrane metalloprotease [Planctomycetes bacterium]|nr:CPBP family intramembrane metalloprotease [Planctomycetota bacterium]MBI3848243.1 CPBP family intramembrane metalloprotease [Planctomycetota bacterium]